MNRGTKKILLQGIVVGSLIGLALRWRNNRSSGARAVDCSQALPGGGWVDGIRYIETVTGGADPNEELPMVISFHSRGASAAGAASFGNLPPTRVIRPEGPVRLSGGSPSWMSLPSGTSDQAAYIAEMEQRSAQIGRFVEGIATCRPTRGKPVVTGSSEGAHMAYLVASQHPQHVSGAVAVLGWIPQPFWNSAMATTVGLHGTNDTTVPYPRTLEFWNAVKGAGAPLTTQTFPVGHSVSSAMGQAWRQAVEGMLFG